MIVVSDTSPISYLILLGEEEILPAMFGEIIAPSVVIEELLHERSAPPVRAWAEDPPQWLRRASPATIPSTWRLDLGETHAIALALELRAEVVVLDDRKARRIAEDAGLRVEGLVALLERAARQSLLDLGEAFDRLKRTNFHLAPELYEAALDRDRRRRSPK